MIKLVSQKTIKTFVNGLKEAETDFIVSLPSTASKHFLPSIMNDPDFIHVPVANENDGMSICVGAWQGGKKPTFLLEDAGLLLSTYSLFYATWFGGAILLVIDLRGDFGDGVANFYFGWATHALRILDSLSIPYTIVRETDKLTAELVRRRRTAEGFTRPAAVLLSMEELWPVK